MRTCYPGLQQLKRWASARPPLAPLHAGNCWGGRSPCSEACWEQLKRPLGALVCGHWSSRWAIGPCDAHARLASEHGLGGGFAGGAALRPGTSNKAARSLRRLLVGLGRRARPRQHSGWPRRHRHRARRRRGALRRPGRLRRPGEGKGGAGPLGRSGLERAGPGWQAGPGWGPGPGGGGTCVFLHKNVRRNRLECRFGAEHRGKKPVFFAGFFP